jgi:organic anion transporter 3A
MCADFMVVLSQIYFFVVGLSSPPLAPHNNLRGDNCIQGSPSTAAPVMLFLLAQLLLGCGGSPLFTLGTTYIDDHVRPDSASLYIGENDLLKLAKYY